MFIVDTHLLFYIYFVIDKNYLWFVHLRHSQLAYYKHKLQTMATVI